MSRNVQNFLVDLANAKDYEAVGRLTTKWAQFSQSARWCVPIGLLGEEEQISDDLRALSFLSSLVRKLWIGDEEAVPKFQQILLTPKSAEASAPSFFRVQWRRGVFSYEPPSELQGAFAYLLEHSDLTKKCGNPDCPRPYFLAEHGNDRYCSSKCFQIARKDAKRAWWNEHGEKWRNAREKPRRTVKRKKAR